MSPAELSSMAAAPLQPDNTHKEHKGRPSSWRQGTTAPIKRPWDPNSNPSHQQVYSFATVSKTKPFLAFHTSRCSESQGEGLTSSKSLPQMATCHTMCPTVP